MVYHIILLFELPPDHLGYFKMNYRDVYFNPSFVVTKNYSFYAIYFVLFL